ncbi:cytochrome P450 [Lepidopterella palustris CBS 459.81]|uniref:Cytochrome P450 n=1 Tax=Lepidopterella palustris CBS 459.81 TaxID=1314670 RepID=A0A8E2JK64_9PEZI|nr:cytochrome P450 [Lepidopterella palustris CBS 459.81]
MRPFQMIGTNGPLILIPPHYTAEIRGDERLTFKSWLKKDFFTNYPGFDGFKPAVENSVFIDSVRMGLTQSLASVVHMLAEETKSCLTEALPPKFDEWQEINFDTRALRIIARLSSRTFLPEPLCHNEEWLRIAVEYTVDFFKAAYVMRSLPAFVRPFVHWFLPQTRKLRGEVQKAREIIMPEVIARQKQAAADIKAGKKPKKYTDAIAWVEEAAEKNSNVCDPVNGQLNYSLGAVHTTAITFINTLYNIVDSPGSVELLREELIDVLGKADGWDKTTLNSLRMMDSYMKESNRMTPASFMTVNRVADQTISLSDGTVIPKGASLTIPNTRLYDSEFYENPDVFNGRRFYDMRMQPGNESKHQFVTTADHYLPFGHGKHACPGRFFASNEIKILLAHMLLGYDWKFPKDQGRPKVVSHGLDGGTNPKARILFKARVPEVSLDLDKKGVSWP